MVNLWNPKVRANSITVPIRANSSWPGSPSSAERFLAAERRTGGGGGEREENALWDPSSCKMYTHTLVSPWLVTHFAPAISNFWTGSALIALREEWKEQYKRFFSRDLSRVDIRRGYIDIYFKIYRWRVDLRLLIVGHIILRLDSNELG